MKEKLQLAKICKASLEANTKKKKKKKPWFYNSGFTRKPLELNQYEEPGIWEVWHLGGPGCYRALGTWTRVTKPRIMLRLLILSKEEESMPPRAWDLLEPLLWNR